MITTAVQRVAAGAAPDSLVEVVVRSVALSLACHVSYLLITRVLNQVHSLGPCCVSAA